MTEKLTISSTLEDLRRCSDDMLVAGIDIVGKEVVLAYILELRERLKQAVLGAYSTPAPSFPSVPCPYVTPSAPPSAQIPGPPSYAITTGIKAASGSGIPAQLNEQSDNYNFWEGQVAKCRSARDGSGVEDLDKLVTFENSILNGRAIDLIKIDHKGNEIFIEENIVPRETRLVHAPFKHVYIAREVRSRKLVVFEYKNDFYPGDMSVILEPLNFGLTEDARGFHKLVMVSPYKDGIELDEYLKDRNPLFLSPPNYKEEEKKAAQAKSVEQTVKRKIKFQNHTPEWIELIWKDHNGNEVPKVDLKPGGTEKLKTFYTHRFIAREKVTRELRSFCFWDKRETVFEAQDLGIPSGYKTGKTADVEIRYLFDCTQ